MKILNPSHLAILTAVLIICTLLSSTTQAASPFTTEGKFSVGSDGSANYSIPIVVPPGTAGMQPQLALNYNSNGGNGIVGMGWGIDGLSQISRCPTTLEQDNVINGVNYTSTDRFCLDGQRLIATTDSYVTHPTDSTRKIYTTTSAYGANGTEYCTESANFAKIISYGQAGTGPAYFKVWTKSGQIIEYGNTVDSGIEAQGKPTIRTWGVNKISDTKGNYIAVTYTEDNANGEAYVQKIDYTGNAASTPTVTPYANIQFIYEARPDTNTAYQAGSVLKTTKRLTNIQTFNATTLIKNYKLTYELSQTTNRSRLKTINECDGGGTQTCKKPIALTYMEGGNGTYGPMIDSTISTGGNYVNGWQITTGDVNGDGKTDVLAVYASQSGSNGLLIRAMLANGDGTYGPMIDSTISTGGNYVNGWQITTGDVNGDGKTDVLAVYASQSGSNGLLIRAMLANGDGTYGPMIDSTISTGGNYVNGWQITTGDVNGDGKTDVLAVYASQSGSNGLLIRAMLANGNGTYGPMIDSTISTGGDYVNGWQITTGDVNGDGKTDVLAVYASQSGSNGLLIRAMLANGNGTYGPMIDSTISTGGNYVNGWQITTGDVNGDGKTDVLAVYASQSGSNGLLIRAMLANGDGTYGPMIDSTISKGGNYVNGWQITTGDVNGDGKTDVLAVYASQSGSNGLLIRAMLANGNGTYGPMIDSTISTGGDYVNGWQITTGDVNGDGKTDVLAVYASQSRNNGLLIRAINSMGTGDDALLNKSVSGSETTHVDYAFISNSIIYAKDVDAIYPIQDVQGPIYVVYSTTVGDGIGGVVTTNYQYGGLKSHLRGRGSLGFRYVKESSPDSGLSVTTFYRQDFPFIGLPSQVEKRRLSDNALLSVVQNTYANSDLATSTIISKFPYLSQSVEQAYELDSTLVSTTTTTNQYDSYGNVTSVNVDDGLGNIKTTTSTYNNNVGNWLLGRLIRSTVTSVTP